MQRRGLCFVLVLVFVALETIFHTAEEESSVIVAGDDSNAILHFANNNNNNTNDKFGFYLMGDTPYATWEEKMLQEQISQLNKNKEDHILFTVHVGDIQKVDRTNCAESHYERVASMLRIGHLPTLVLPGDNDWYDCEDREASFSFFQQHLVSLEQDWQHELPIVRSKERPELFCFENNGILFLSIHLINGRVQDESADSRSARMEMNQEWVTKQLDNYFGKMRIRGVILLGHSLRSPRTRPFFEALATNFLNVPERLKVPVIYLHGDGHKWDVDQKFSHQLGWKYYYDIQVDQGAFADPCIVEVAKQVNGKLIPLRQEHENQHLLGKGLVRIDRQRGLYTSDYLDQWMEWSTC